MGDFNVNLLTTDSDHSGSEYCTQLCYYIFAPLFYQPTRATEKPKTLIDKMYFNSFQFKTHSGNIVREISDHLLQFVLLGSFLRFGKSSIN